MTILKSACVALTAVLYAATMTTGAAQAAHIGGGMGGGMGGGGIHMGGGRMGGGPIGGHVGHAGHMNHVAHMDHDHMGHDHDHDHHHHFHGSVVGLGLYGDDGYYDSSYYDDEGCYRVYRHHAWRVVCD